MNLYTFILKRNNDRTDLIGKEQEVETSILFRTYNQSIDEFRQLPYVYGDKSIFSLITIPYLRNVDFNYYSIIEVTDDGLDKDKKFDINNIWFCKPVRFVSDEEFNRTLLLVKILSPFLRIIDKIRLYRLNKALDKAYIGIGNKDNISNDKKL